LVLNSSVGHGIEGSHEISSVFEMVREIEEIIRWCSNHVYDKKGRE
jgi:hypothetical protein